MTDGLLTYLISPLLLLGSVAIAILQWMQPGVSNPAWFIIVFSLATFSIGLSVGRRWKATDNEVEIENNFLRHLEREGNF